MRTDSSRERPEANETLVEAPQIQVSPGGAQALLEAMDDPPVPKRLIRRARQRKGATQNDAIRRGKGSFHPIRLALLIPPSRSMEASRWPIQSTIAAFRIWNG